MVKHQIVIRQAPHKHSYQCIIRIITKDVTNKEKEASSWYISHHDIPAHKQVTQRPKKARLSSRTRKKNIPLHNDNHGQCLPKGTYYHLRQCPLLVHPLQTVPLNIYKINISLPFVLQGMYFLCWFEM